MARKQLFLIELLIPIFSSWNHLERPLWGPGTRFSALGTEPQALLERAKRKWNVRRALGTEPQALLGTREAQMEQPLGASGTRASALGTAPLAPSRLGRYKPCAIIWLHPIDLEGLLIFRILGQVLLCQFLFDGLFVLGVHQRDHGPFEARS